METVTEVKIVEENINERYEVFIANNHFIHDRKLGKVSVSKDLYNELLVRGFIISGPILDKFLQNNRIAKSDEVIFKADYFTQLLKKTRGTWLIRADRI